MIYSYLSIIYSVAEVADNASDFKHDQGWAALSLLFGYSLLSLPEMATVSMLSRVQTNPGLLDPVGLLGALLALLL